MRLATAFSGVIPVSAPLRTMSSTDSIARYGLTAAAPKPMSRATWWTSRTSPASMSRPTWVRVFSRSKWWWTAEVSNSDGIGARSALESRSESTTKRTPREIAAETSAKICSIRAVMAAAPPLTG
ncbi:MAG: hypothetical protein BWY91_02511 [bacterium ADurb.BinA028]|nr:MAG: hypothetical protein BWY91_02511 [bacterium ADurb.BinA028]